MVHLRYILAWALGFLTTLAVASEQEARPWLERMAKSLQTQSYQGTFVYLNGYHLESLRISRAVDGEREWERLVSLNGVRREIVKNGQAVTSILPNARSVFSRSPSQENTFPAVLGKSYSALQAHYRFLVSHSDRVAERDTVQILVVPRDRYRYGYHLWLDVETAIPLRLSLIDEKGSPLEQVMFTRFNLLGNGDLPEIPKLSRAPFEEESLKRTTPAGEGADRWRVQELPAGFTLHSRGEETMPGSSERVQHLVFTDGLVTVSAYIEKMVERRGLNGASRRGAISAFGKRQSGYQVTVVGEVPPRTVEQIARSIQVSSDD